MAHIGVRLSRVEGRTAMGDPMFTFDPKMADLILDQCRRRLSLNPVPLDFGSHVHERPNVLDGWVDEGGHDARDVLALYNEHLAPGVVSADSPRFLAFIPNAPTKAASLFDMIVSCSSLGGVSWLESAGVVLAENQALDVIAREVGLPAGAGGCFVSGGSAGNLSALLVAREESKSEGVGVPPGGIAISSQAHSSVAKAAFVLGMEVFVVTGDDHRLTGESLRRWCDANPRLRERVVAVVGSAGTTNAGIVDDLDGIADVCAANRWWFHVDGAYGAAGVFAPSAKGLFSGIERADSMIVDPHKWLFSPLDCAALLYRNPAMAKAVHTQDAAYLAVLHSGSVPETPRTGPWNPSDYAYHLSRRARGLPFWFSLAVHGVGAYRIAIESAISHAKEAASAISACPYTELVRDPVLSVVLFRRLGWTPAQYVEWSDRLIEDQIAFVTPTAFDGETIARMAFIHPDTDDGIVDTILSSMA